VDTILVRPNKTPGRVVLGPRLIGTNCLRIVSRADGSGRIQLYDPATAAWCDASERWTFDDIWSAGRILDAKHLALL
jgi:hypothetical protein